MTAASDQPRTGPADASSGTLMVSPPRLFGAGAALLAVFVAIFWFFFYAQVRSAMNAPSDWGHILVIPLISAYFIWRRRAELLAEPFRPAWAGIALMAVGLAIYFLGYLGPRSVLVHTNARGAGVGLTLFGVALLLFGWRSMRYLWFPLGYWVVFGQVISDAIIKPVTELLQDLSARGAWLALNLVQVETERDGNVLTVWHNGVRKPLNVAEACSGMRMLLAFLALGVAIAHTGLPRWWQKALLVGAGIPIAVGVNVLRVMTLGILSLWDVDFAAGEFHNMVGLVWLVPAFVMYMGVLWVLRNLLIEDDGSADAGPDEPAEPARAYPFAPIVRLAYGVAFGVLLAGSVGFMGGMRYLNYYLVKEPVPLRAPIDGIPIRLGEWERLGKDNILTDAIIEELGTKQYVDRMYGVNGAPERGLVQVHVAYYTGTIDDVPHIPDRCWGVAGFLQTQDAEDYPIEADTALWNLKSGTVNAATGLTYPTVMTPDPITGAPARVHLPVGDLKIRITEFQDPKRPKRRLVGGYLFIANGRLTPNPYGVRALAFERTERYAYYCKVQFSMSAELKSENDSLLPLFRRNADELFSLLVPHLMARLPDWPEVERMSREAVAEGAASSAP
jgi:exosortase